MRRAAKATKKFGASVISVTLKVAAMAAAMVAAAAAAAVFMVKSQINLIDALGKVAQKLGIEVGALQALRHAAVLAGVPIQQLDLGLQRMARRISEAAVGTGEAQGALKEMGLVATELRLLPLEEQFLAIAKALGKTKVASDRLRLGFKMFDSEGVALINIAELIEGRFEAIREEVKRLGFELSAFDLGQIGEAKVAIDRLKAIVTGLAQRITVELVPFLTVAINKLIDMATEGDRMKRAVGAAMKAVAIGAGLVALHIDGIKASIEGVIAVTAVWQLQFAKLEETLAASQLRAALGKTGKQNPFLSGAPVGQIASTVAAYDRLNAAIAEVARLQALANGKVQTFANRLEGLKSGDAFKGVIEAFRKMREELKKLEEDSFIGKTSPKPDFLGGISEDMKKRLALLKGMAAGIIAATRTPMEKFIKQMQDLQEMLRNKFIDPDTFRRAAKAARDALTKAREPDATRAGQFRQIRSLSSVAIGGTNKMDNAQAKRDTTRDKILDGVRDAILEMRDQPVKLAFA